MDQQALYPVDNGTDENLVMTVKDLPREMRPREEFVRRGAANVPDETLIAILLRTGIPGKNVTDLARELLLRHKGLDNLCNAEYEELLGLKIKGLGKVKSLELAAAFEISRRVIEHRQRRGQLSEHPLITTPEAVFKVLFPLAQNLEQEVFWTILLNTKNRLMMEPLEITRGLLNSTQVHPREVFKKAIRYNAATVILAHNHPSGDPTPSSHDIAITNRLVQAARIIGILVTDHVIIGKPSPTCSGYHSLRSTKLVNFDK